MSLPCMRFPSPCRPMSATWCWPQLLWQPLTRTLKSAVLLISWAMDCDDVMPRRQVQVPGQATMLSLFLGWCRSACVNFSQTSLSSVFGTLIRTRFWSLVARNSCIPWVCVISYRLVSCWLDICPSLSCNGINERLSCC